MNRINSLNVFMDGKQVGRLALTSDLKAAFQYSEEWLQSGFSISPLSLPLQNDVFIPKNYETFDGLFGVFFDSLPDGWGKLLVDRTLLKYGVNLQSIDSLTRLSIVGNSGMGALTYEPENDIKVNTLNMPIDTIAKECMKMFEAEESDALDTLFEMGGSSGGARPKVNYLIDGEDWIVKFPASYDPTNIGKQEYEYSLCAKQCGIDMPETRLLPSSINEGYFAVKRFDRDKKKRIHMISASALLETSHRIPNLDYHNLMALTAHITGSFEEVEKLYKLMCFNVFAHNRDDHSKNFSWLYCGDKYVLSPAYDLTYSNSIGGQHATTVNGNGENPSMEDILAVAKKAKLDLTKSKKQAEEIRECVYEMLKI